MERDRAVCGRRTTRQPQRRRVGPDEFARPFAVTAGLMNGAKPIFSGQVFDSREFAFVGGDDGVPERDGVGGAEYVVAANGPAHALQTGATRAVSDGGSRVERRDLNCAKHSFDLLGKPPSPGLLRPVSQFGCYDGAGSGALTADFPNAPRSRGPRVADEFGYDIRIQR